MLRLAARELRGRPGVVYLPLSQSTPGVLRDSMFVFAASMRGWKIAAHLRGSEFREYYCHAHPAQQWWIRAMLARLDSVAVMGESLKAVFDGLVSSERIAVVPNGTPEFEPEHAVQRDPEHVLFLSNLRRRKGVIEAVEAALRVLADRPSARFTFAGDWEDSELEMSSPTARRDGRTDESSSAGLCRAPRRTSSSGRPLSCSSPRSSPRATRASCSRHWPQACRSSPPTKARFARPSLTACRASCSTSRYPIFWRLVCCSFWMIRCFSSNNPVLPGLLPVYVHPGAR